MPNKGRNAVAVKGSRQILDRAENYFWLLSVEGDENTKSIILTNNNMVGSNVPESLIQNVSGL